jgi:hypothetical protein
MSKKDFQALAEMMYRRQPIDSIGEARNLWSGLLEDLCALLCAQNPRFDRGRFVEACKTGACKGMRKRA